MDLVATLNVSISSIKFNAVVVDIAGMVFIESNTVMLALGAVFPRVE